MQITDCHIHAKTTGVYHDNITDLIRRMQKWNIARAIISDLGDWSAFPDYDTLVTANERVRRECLISDGRLEYLVYINPQIQNWQEIFDRFYQDSCGVKLWISLRSKEYGLERTREVLRLAAKFDKAVLIHTFNRTNPEQPGEIGVDEIIDLAASVPECRIVAAHSGGNWRRAIERAAEFPENVFFDVSGTYPERTMVRSLVDTFGSRRILYGSDAYGRSFGSQLSKFLNSGLGKDELTDILCENCMRVFKLSSAKPCEPQRLSRWNISGKNVDNFCFTGRSDYFEHSVAPEMLVKAAGRCGVDTLYAASLEAMASERWDDINLRHRKECAVYPQIKPLAVADLRDMPQSVRLLSELDGFAGVIISPYLHNYKLSYKPFAQFFDICSKQDIPIWINTAFGDDRFRHPKLLTRCVTVDEIIAFASEIPICRCVLQGAPADPELSKALPPHFMMECSRVSDWEYAPDEMFKDGDPERLCYGSEYPFREYGSVLKVLAYEPCFALER